MSEAAAELVLQFRGPRVETEDEIVEIEDALVELLTDGESLAGHALSRTARAIHVATEDAEATFRRVRPFLVRAKLIDEVVVAACPAGGGARTTLWPPGCA